MNGIDFTARKYSSGPITGICLKAYNHLDIQSVPFDQLKEEPMEPFKLEKSTRSRCTVSFDFTGNGSTKRIYVKRYRVWRIARKLGYLFISPKAYREWKLGYSLLQRGITTPIPLVAAMWKKGPFVKENYLVTLGLEPYRPAPEWFKGMPAGSERNEWIRDLARFVRRVHNVGFYHDDFNLAHVFIHDPGKGERDFALIDLDNGRLMKHVPSRLAIRNISQIFRSMDDSIVSREERRLFLKTWFGTTPPEDFIRRINQLVQRKQSHALV